MGEIEEYLQDQLVCAHNYFTTKFETKPWWIKDWLCLTGLDNCNISALLAYIRSPVFHIAPYIYIYIYIYTYIYIYIYVYIYIVACSSSMQNIVN